MNKETKKNSKDAVITGASTTVGAALGTVAGGFINSELNATELNDNTEIISDAEVVSKHEDVLEPAEPTVTINVPEPEPTPEPTPEPEPESIGGLDIDIKVLNYETIIYDNYNQIDVALLDVGGIEVCAVDEDHDDKIDYIIIDENNNDTIEEGEIIDVSENNFSMQAIEDEYYDNLLADNNDYNNIADVSDYYA